MKTKSFRWGAVVIPALLAFASQSYAQNIVVKGSLSTTSGPVRFALITFIDKGDPTKTFVALTDSQGNYKENITTSVEHPTWLPTKFELEQNYPNPFTSSTSIQYKLSEESTPSVRIYNILGQLVKEFKVGTQNSGIHGVMWDGTNSFGTKVAAGVYVYRLITQNNTQAKKMLFGLPGGNSARLLFAKGTSVAAGIQSGKNLISAGGIYTILIQNTDTTSPTIDTTRYNNVVLQSDSTMNLTANESNDFALCYASNRQIILNNIKGTHRRSISTNANEDDYPQWSPVGGQIVYQHSLAIYGPATYAYDVNNQSTLNLTSDGGLSGSLPQWTPNGKVYFAYERPILSSIATYLMNADGSSKKKMLDSIATIVYFYSDNYNFLYLLNWTQVFKTNIDDTAHEFICDLTQSVSQQIAAQDFNPSTGDILLTYVPPVHGFYKVASYNVNTKSVTDLLTADSGYVFMQVKYSNDRSKIALVEHSDNDEYLSVLENGIKKRLVQLPTVSPSINFSFNPMQFSSDGNHIAYSEQFWQTGSWVSWKEFLFVVDVSTGAVRLIDEGFYPSWKPGP